MIRLGVWHIPYSFRDVQCLFLASAQNTQYKTPDRQAAEFLLMKDGIENSCSPHPGIEPPPSVQQAGALPLYQTKRITSSNETQKITIQQNKTQKIFRVRRNTKLAFFSFDIKVTNLLWQTTKYRLLFFFQNKETHIENTH